MSSDTGILLFETLREAMFGATRTEFHKRSERICVLEVDLNRMSPDDVPKNRTFRILGAIGIVAHWRESRFFFVWDIRYQ